MNIPDKKRLLKEFDKTNYRERIKRMFLLGKEVRGNDKFEELLASLDKGDLYEKSLSLFAAISAKDNKRVVSCLKSDSKMLRNIALSGLLNTDDEIILKEIDNLAINTRRALLKNISFHKKTALSEKLFPHILEKYGYKEALYLFPCCSRETVEKYLPEIGEKISKWKTPARYHGETVLSYIKNRFTISPEREYHLLWNLFSGAIEILINSKASEILSLALKYSPAGEIPCVIENNLAILVKKDKSLVFNLITGKGYKGTVSTYGLPQKLLKHIRKFSKEEIITMSVIMRESPGQLADLLKNLSPSMREDIFTGVYEAIDIENYEWPHNLLEILPHRIRHKEAERMLNLRKIREDRNLTLEISSFCDIEKMRDFFYKSAKSPEAEERGKALNHLINCTGLNRKGLKETLSYLEGFKNDQDPVKLLIFKGLSDIVPSLFKEEHIENLENLIASVISARDTSPATNYAVQTLAMNIFSYNVINPEGKLLKFSLGILKKIATLTGHLSLPYMNNLPGGMEYKLVEVLKPVIISSNKIESYELILSLARSLGKKGWYIKSLQDMLEPVTDAKPDYTASDAIDLWLSPPKTRDERVWKLIKKDRSVITLKRVFNHIHHHRQEWLNYFLDGRAIKGKFLTGKTLYLLPAVNGFYRWLPGQQKAFSKLLHRVAKDKERNTWERCQAIKKLAIIPSVTLEELAGYLKYDDINIIEAALGSLSKIDNPGEALKILMEYLDNDRARVAMYTIPACIPFISPHIMRNIFTELLSRPKLKVTVQKEIMRFAGKYHIDTDLSILKNEWEKEDLHRDVRIAILHAVRQMIDIKEAWSLLEKGAASTDPAIAMSLLYEKPSGLSIEEKQDYVKLILKISKHSDLQVRKAAFSSLSLWSAGSEDIIAGRASEVILDIEKGTEWRVALFALLSSCCDGRAGDAVSLTVRDLSTCSLEKYNGDTERDLPAIQRLSTLVESLVTLPYENRVRLKDLLKKLPELMSPWAREIYRGKLFIASISWDNPSECADMFIKVAEKFKEVFSSKCLIEYIESLFQKETIRLELHDLVEIIDRLIVSEKTQLPALILLRIAGERFKWPSNCRQRLRALRLSESDMVRTEALNIWTARE
jgi:hypothetical protein